MWGSKVVAKPGWPAFLTQFPEAELMDAEEPENHVEGMEEDTLQGLPYNPIGSSSHIQLTEQEVAQVDGELFDLTEEFNRPPEELETAQPDPDDEDNAVKTLRSTFPREFDGLLRKIIQSKASWNFNSPTLDKENPKDMAILEHKLCVAVREHLTTEFEGHWVVFVGGKFSLAWGQKPNDHSANYKIGLYNVMIIQHAPTT